MNNFATLYLYFLFNPINFRCVSTSNLK